MRPVDRLRRGRAVPQGFFHGTTEAILGAGASLAVASIQEFGRGQVTFQHRHARIGEGASMQWALAQVGGRLVRSRVDNRLEATGARSSRSRSCSVAMSSSST